MKNSILLLVLFVTCNCLYSQSNNNKAEYQAKKIDVILHNDRGEELTKFLYGEAVSISFDKVSNAVEIKFQNNDGGTNAMTLFSASENYSKENLTHKMKDDLGNNYRVFGNIEQNGTFIIVFDNKTKGGNTTMLSIRGAKRV
jgi:hypothetical protein